MQVARSRRCGSTPRGADGGPGAGASGAQPAELRAGRGRRWTRHAPVAVWPAEQDTGDTRPCDAAGTVLLASNLRANRRLTRTWRLLYDGPTSSASRATAPERKARRRRRSPGAHWRATGSGGHDSRAARPGWGRGAATGIAPRGRGYGSWATSPWPPQRCAHVGGRSGGSRPRRPGVRGNSQGSPSSVSLRGPRQPQDWAAALCMFRTFLLSGLRLKALGPLPPMALQGRSPAMVL
jgi:hypothetical protein